MKMEKFAYIGCRTTKERKARGKGISVYKVDGDNWELVQILDPFLRHGNLFRLCIPDVGNAPISTDSDQIGCRLFR